MNSFRRYQQCWNGSNRHKLWYNHLTFWSNPSLSLKFHSLFKSGQIFCCYPADQAANGCCCPILKNIQIRCQTFDVFHWKIFKYLLVLHYNGVENITLGRFLYQYAYVPTFHDGIWYWTKYCYTLYKLGGDIWEQNF